MAEIKQEKTSSPKADPSEMLLAEVEARNKDPNKPKRKETAGEVAFNRIVYTGIGFGVNEASAIVIADEFEHGLGKKWFEKISDWMVKSLKFKDTVKNGVTTSAKANAANMLLWGSLLISGTLLVYPMKKLEDNKGYWVKKINHWFDKMRGNPQVDDLVINIDGRQLPADQATQAELVAARDKEVEEALACEAKQTWPSLLIGRSIAVVTALGLGKAIGAEGSKKMQNWSEKLLTGSVAETKNRAHRYAAIASLETLSCAATSIMLEMSSKLFAKKFITSRDPEKCTQQVHHDLAETIKASSDSSTATDSSESGKPHEITAAPLVPAATETDKFAHLKKKPVAKLGSHVEAAKASETSYSLAT